MKSLGLPKSKRFFFTTGTKLHEVDKSYLVAGMLMNTVPNSEHICQKCFKIIR